MIPPPGMYPLDTTSEISEDIFTWAFNIPLYIIAIDNKKPEHPFTECCLHTRMNNFPTMYNEYMELL